VAADSIPESAVYKKAKREFPPLHPREKGKGVQEVTYYSDNNSTYLSEASL